MAGSKNQNGVKLTSCCLCGCKFTGLGNNPWPLSENENDRCCNACNEVRVIPARIELRFRR